MGDGPRLPAYLLAPKSIASVESFAFWWPTVRTAPYDVSHNETFRLDGSDLVRACFSAKELDPKAIVDLHTAWKATGIDASNNTTQIPRVFTTPISLRGGPAMMNVTENKDTAMRKRVNEQMNILKWPSSLVFAVEELPLN